MARAVRIVPAAALLLASTPALATSTMRCSSPDRGAPILYVSVGSGSF